MTATLKVRKIGNSLGVILPKEVAEQLNLREDDTLHVVVNADGAHLTPFDPQFEKAMEAFERTRRKYRNALRELAK